MNRLVLLPAAAAVLAAGSAQAQQRTIVPGQLTRGTLSTSDPRLTDDTFYDEYVFSGRRGETVVVSMESGTFDSFLHLGVLRYGQWQSLSTDDDGGGGTNSRIQLQLPEDGTYAIRANSLSRDFGEYTLSLVGGRAGSAGSGKEGVVGMYDAAPTQPYGGGRGGRFLEPGRRIDAYLSSSDPVLDGREPFHIYTYAGRRGERLAITARSTDFDAYLVLGTPGGRHGVASALARNDDGAGGTDARVDFTLPYDGEYVIRVNPMVAGTGNYTLEVQSSLRGGGYDRR